jgi:hypothetical protein
LGSADISTSHPVLSIGSARHRHPHEPALLLAPSVIASALASQRLLGQPPRHRLSVVVPLVACLALARRGDDCPENRRPRARAQSARVMAVHRKEADLDRFVAALLALAMEPGPHSGRRHKPTGELSRVEQSCRR